MGHRGDVENLESPRSRVVLFSYTNVSRLTAFTTGDCYVSDGQRFRSVCVVDDSSRECLATVVDASLIGVRVVRELDRLPLERDTPKTIVS